MTAPSADLLAAWAAPVAEPEAHVYVAWDGGTYEDETARLLSTGGVLSWDPDSRHPQVSTATIVLSNEDGRFSPADFTGPLYGYLGRTGQPVRITAGYGGHVVQMAQFWLVSLAPSEKDRTVTLKVHDRLGALSGVKVAAAGSIGVRTDDAFRMIAAAGGLTEGVHYTVEVGVNTCVTVIPGGPLVLSLAQVAQAEGGRLTVDGSGVLHLLNQTTTKALNVALWTVRRSTQAYEIIHRRRDPSQNNRVLLTASQRKVQVEEPCGETEGFVYGSEVSGGLCYPWLNTVVVEGRDPYSGEMGKVELTTVHSIAAWVYAGFDYTTMRPKRTGAAVSMVNSEPPSGGVTPSNTVYYTWTAEGTKGVLRLWAATDSFIIFAFEPHGLPWRQYPEVSYTADDPDAQAESGVVSPLDLANDFLPMNAAVLARDVLVARISGRSGADLPDVDGMPWAQPGDVFDLIDDDVAPEVTYRVMILSHEWSINGSGQFSSGVTTTALDANLQEPPPVVETYIVAPSGTPTHGTDQQPPWSWGPAGQPAIADYSDWG